MAVTRSCRPLEAWWALRYEPGPVAELQVKLRPTITQFPEQASPISLIFLRLQAGPEARSPRLWLRRRRFSRKPSDVICDDAALLCQRAQRLFLCRDGALILDLE